MAEATATPGAAPTQPQFRRPVDSLAGRVAFALTIAGWIYVLGSMLTRTIFISHDSLSDFAHVWWISDRLWHGHGIPLHAPMAAGRAFTFPYGVIPWLAATLLWPLFGAWSVTLCIVIGFVGMAVAMFWAFPELGRGWWAAAAMVQPTLVIAPIIGQLPFIWAMGFAFAAIGCRRRGRWGWATAALAASLATHVAVMLPMLAVLIAIWWWFEPDRARLLRCIALAGIVVIPAALLVVLSPVFGDINIQSKLYNVADTVLPRSVVLLVPFVVLGLEEVQRRWPGVLTRSIAPACFVVSLVLNVVFEPAFNTNYAWGALHRRPNVGMRAFTTSKVFVPGETYRVLRASDGKVGMYDVMRAGGVLDSEFFPESFGRRSYPSLEAYSKELRKRRVDQVVVFDTYDRQFKTNEHALLRRLAGRGLGGCTSSIVGAERTLSRPGFDVYRIRRNC